jgi:hypothetical protein
MFDFILGKEKAIVGGLSAGILTLLSTVGITGQMTVKSAIYAVVAWVVTHVVIFLTANSKDNSLVGKANDLAADVVHALRIVNDQVTAQAQTLRDENTANAAASPQLQPIQLTPEQAEEMSKAFAAQAAQPAMHASDNADGSQDEATGADQTETSTDTTAAPSA